MDRARNKSDYIQRYSLFILSAEHHTSIFSLINLGEALSLVLLERNGQ